MYSAGKKYAEKHYVFSKERVLPDDQLNKSFSSFGKWCSIKRDMKSFPSYVASVLSGREYEWYVAAIVSKDTVCRMWVYTQNNPYRITLRCSLDDMIDECRKTGADAVFLFHNIPHPDPESHTALVASTEDVKYSKMCGESLSGLGVNFFSFICSNSEFLRYYSCYSEKYEAPGYTLSDFIDLYGISPQMDAALLRKYGQQSLPAVSENTAKWIVIAAVALIIIVLAVIGYVSLSQGQITRIR